MEVEKRMRVRNADKKVGGDVLVLDKGDRTDMMFHTHTVGVLYVLSGQLKVTVIKDGKIRSLGMNAGASFEVTAGLVYQLEALENAIVVEFLSQLEDVDTFIVSRGGKADSVSVVETPVEASPTPVVAQDAVVVNPPVETKKKRKGKK